MNKKLTTADRFPIGVGSYVSPEATVSEIHSEGVLCASEASATLSVEEWQNGTFEW